MIFNREEECTKAEKEYYDTIGIYTLILFIGFVISLLISYIINPLLKLIPLQIDSVCFFIVNLLIYIALSKNVFLVFCIIYGILILFFLGCIFVDNSVRAINILEYPLYILCGINIIVLLGILIFGSCEKIDHDCNVESWPDEFKTDEKSSREDLCNNLNETCMNDKNKSEDECGTCSDIKYNNEDDCNDNNGVWTSRYTKCFWSKPSDKKVSSCDITTDSPPLEVHEGSCVYDLDKCASINCNDFQPTTVFYDCCEENTRGWEENMDCDTLRTQIDANKTDEGRIGGSDATQRAGELEAEYNLRVAASSQTSNIHNQDLYE